MHLEAYVKLRNVSDYGVLQMFVNCQLHGTALVWQQCVRVHTYAKANFLTETPLHNIV